jgi:hypothetical protein
LVRAYNPWRSKANLLSRARLNRFLLRRLFVKQQNLFSIEDVEKRAKLGWF